LLWQQQFGLGGMAVAAGGVVPEPNGLALAALGLGAVGEVMRRNALRCGGPARRG